MQIEAILKKIKNIPILVVGDIILDHYIKGNVDRISPEAPVPVVDLNEEQFILGGAANVCLNAMTLGAKASLMGIVGEDLQGSILKNLFKSKKLAFHSLPKKSKANTIIKTRIIGGNQQICRVDREDKNVDYKLDISKILDFFKKNIQKYKAVILSDYAKGSLSNSWVPAFIQLANENKLFVSIDPKPYREIDFKGIDLLTPNKHEAYRLARIDPLSTAVFPKEAICKSIYNRYKPKNLVITLGAEGMLLSQKGKIIKQIPTVAQEVFDVCGAGDTVISCLTAALSAGASLEDAAKLANTAAGITVSKIGTATVSPAEIIAFSHAN